MHRLVFKRGQLFGTRQAGLKEDFACRRRTPKLPASDKRSVGFRNTHRFKSTFRPHGPQALPQASADDALIDRMLPIL